MKETNQKGTNNRRRSSRKPDLRPQIALCVAAGVLLILLTTVVIRKIVNHPSKSGSPESGNTAVTASLSAEAPSAAAQPGDGISAGAQGMQTVSDGQTAAGTVPSAAGSGSGEIPLLAADIQNNGAAASPQASSGAAAVPSPTEAPKWASPMERYYKDDTFWNGCPERDVQLLTPNEYSRPETGLDEVNDIVIHYVDEPGSTAQQNRDYFESLKDGSGRSVSSHFIISLDGTIVQCVPLGEVAYASNHRNSDTISIECCHPDSSGEFTEETYASCIDLTAWLCYAFEISPDHVIRHYDVSGKDCPIFYVRNPEAWEQLKRDVADRYDEYVADYGPRS